MTNTTDHDTGGPTDQALHELLDAERHWQGVTERRRRYWLRVQAEESRSFATAPGALDPRSA